MIATEHHHVAPSTRARLLYLVALVLAPLACVALYVFDPAARNDPYPNCPFLMLTGYYCPGCGTLRAYHQLLRGNGVEALGLNPLTVVALPAMVYAVASAWLTGFRGHGLPVPRWNTSASIGLAVGLVAFAVIRNVPVEALEWMRP